MHDSSQNDEIAQEVSCDSLDENMSINNSSLSTTFTTAGREKELLAPILVFMCAGQYFDINLFIYIAVTHNNIIEHFI